MRAVCLDNRLSTPRLYADRAQLEFALRRDGPERSQRANAVGPDREAGTNLTKLAAALQHHGPEALTARRHRRGQTSDSSPDYEDVHGQGPEP
jgi:hypothetical protein